MDKFFVRNRGLCGVTVNIGQREVDFNSEGVSGPLTEAEYDRLITIPGFDPESAILGQQPADEVDLGDADALPAEGEAPAEAEAPVEGITLAEFGAMLGISLEPTSGALDLDTLDTASENPAEADTVKRPDFGPELLELFPVQDLDVRIEWGARGDLSRAQLVELFNLEASRRNSKKVLAALQAAMDRLPRATAESVNANLDRPARKREE